MTGRWSPSLQPYAKSLVDSTITVNRRLGDLMANVRCPLPIELFFRWRSSNPGAVSNRTTWSLGHLEISAADAFHHSVSTWYYLTKRSFLRLNGQVYCLGDDLGYPHVIHSIKEDIVRCFPRLCLGPVQVVVNDGGEGINSVRR